MVTALIRPDLMRRLRPWFEPVAAILAGLVCLWIALLGGWFFAGLGLLGGAVALAWLIGSLRRARFARDVAAPGVVEIDEGAIRYYGARLLGGQMALRELSEIRLIRLGDRGHWRLKSLSGEAMLIPIDAAGAASLADAFVALPGLDMGAVSAALARIDRGGPALHILWRRPA